MPSDKRTEQIASAGSHQGQRALVEGGRSGLRLKKALVGHERELLGGHYRLLGSLGFSAYGHAYQAVQEATGRTVAIHFLPLESGSESVMVHELQLAVAKCAQLVHPNVIAVEDCGLSSDGLRYVVTAALEGEPLSDYLRRVGPLPVSRALALMRQIGRAVRAAHKLDILHGDLRPANVRIVRGELAKLVGFGREGLLREQDGPTDVRIMRSPAYTAPELHAGAQVGPRSEVYALGAMLFRMIAGEPPYPRRSPNEVVEAHVHEAVPGLRERAGSHVPFEVDLLVMRCLSKRSEDRYADVVAFMHAMRVAVGADDPSDERPYDSVSEHLDDRDVSAIVPLPLVVNSILPNVVAQPEPERPSMMPESERSLRLWLVLGAILLLTIAGEIAWERFASNASGTRALPRQLEVGGKAR